MEAGYVGRCHPRRHLTERGPIPFGQQLVSLGVVNLEEPHLQASFGRP